MLKIESFEFNPFGEKTYVVYDPESRECMVVDPGMVNGGEEQIIDDWLAGKDLKVKYAVATHMHLDHVWGVPHVKSKYGVGLTAHPADGYLGAILDGQAQMFGQRRSPGALKADIEVADGDILTLGTNRVEVLHVPGHSPGGIALYDAADGFVIGGDSLFRGSIGRTDLPGGDPDGFVDKIKSKLMTLPSDTIVYPGHGPSTTIGAERSGNPWLR